MNRSILCGVDGSPVAQDAVRVAASLAHRFGVRLIVAHVAQIPVPAGHQAFGSTTMGGDVGQAREAGAGLLERVAAADEVISDAEQRLLIGDPAEQLAELAEQEDAELLVVGSRGRGPFKSAFLGSVSHDVIGLAPCPVVVVPPGLD